MAVGMCRVRIDVQNLRPFWLQVDFDEYPRIRDVKQKIQVICREVDIDEIFLQGCILPIEETSRVLRENDLIVATLRQVPNSAGLEKSVFTESCGSRATKKKPDKISNKSEHSELSEHTSVQKDSRLHKESLCNGMRKDVADGPTDKTVTGDSPADKGAPGDSPADKAVSGDSPADKAVTSVTTVISPKETKRSRRRKRTAGAVVSMHNSETVYAKSIFSCDPSVEELKLPVHKQPRSRKTVFLSDDEAEIKSDESKNNTEGSSDAQMSAIEVSQTWLPDSDATQSPVSCPFGVSKEDATVSSHRNKKTKTSRQDKAKMGTVPPYVKSPFKCEDNLKQSALEVMAQYQKMIGGEHGLPAYVRAERLGNGVVKYTRTTHTVGNKAFHPLIRDTSSALDKSRLSAIHRKKQQGTPQKDQNMTADAVKFAPHALEEIKTSDVRIMAVPLYHDFSKLPSLKTVPKCGDYIAYKVLELGKDYTPRISEYKEAEVLHCDEESKTVTLRLLHNKNGETRTAGKFDLQYLSTEEDVTDEVTLEMASLLDPKVLHHNQATES